MFDSSRSLEDRIKVEAGDLIEVPRSTKRQHTFRINDIDLVVPPTDITIQKEDLIHQWRTLRSNASTKIPSGQGQIAVSVVIAFTGGQVLDMHRLIVEFRHSPFCYIENRFLRETISPHWPITQNMAFTMTGLSVAPMQGSSDTWIMQLDLTWFNYAPYVHNWLYRRDWHTVPVRAEGPFEEVEPMELTIGWDWDGDRKVPRHTILPGLSNAVDNGVRTWDVVQNKYNDRKTLTIEEMQELHRGEIFDLQPMPGRMQPALTVPRPDQSLIYTRYINYLQRDALKRNFGIDVEQDLRTPGGKPTPLSSSMFSAILEGQVRRTYGLHQGPPRDSGLYRTYRAAAAKWVQEMNSYHGGVIFSFAAYNELRMPVEYAEAIQSAHADSIENARNDLGISSQFAEAWMEHYDFHDMVELRGKRVFGRSLVRRGWTYPDGRYAPIGPKDSAVPYDVDKLPLPRVAEGQTGHVSYRGPLVAKKLYSSPHNHKPHYGTDFPVGVGYPVFAVSAGKVTRANAHNSSRDGVFKLLQLDGDVWAGATVSSTSPEEKAMVDMNDFELSLRTHVPGVQFKAGGRVVGLDAEHWPVGMAVPSVGIQGAYYVVMPKSGGQGITIDHGKGEWSSYVHLSEVLVDHGDQVDAGQLIGYTGKTGPFKEDFLKQAMDVLKDGEVRTETQIIPVDQQYLAAGEEEPTSIWLRGAHLHFEYWEPLDMAGNRDPEYPEDEIPRIYDNSHSGLVPVDPISSYKLAVSGSPKIEIDPTLLRADDEDVSRALTAELGEEVASGLMETLTTLWDDGWMYYDREASVTNIWWKQFHLNADRLNGELNQGMLRNSPVVLSAVAGGLRHVVANIPILGHEFPTQQHLGSIEPFYSFEFCSLDNQGTGAEYLAGLPKEAQLLMAMRGMLHSNARNFRPVVDSWAVAGDSFITRLLGSYRENDVLWKEGEGVVDHPLEGPKKVVDDTMLLRRLINTRGTSQTIKGQPGLACHSLEFQETNPYTGEFISSTAPVAGDLEDAFCQILTKLYNWDFADEYKDVLTQILIAQLAGAQTSVPGGSDYGKYELQYLLGADQLDSVDGAALYSAGDEEFVVFGDPDPELVSLLSSLQQNVVTMPGTSIIGIPAALLTQPVKIENTRTKEWEATRGGLIGPLGLGARQATRAITNYHYDVSELLNQTQSNQLAAEIPLPKILDYWALIHETIVSAEMMLAEDQLQVQSGGRVEPGGVSEETARQELYCLPVKPSLFKYFQHWLSVAAEAAKIDWQLNWGDMEPGQATWQMQNNINWLYWSDGLDGDEKARIFLTNEHKGLVAAEGIGYGLLKTWDVAWTTATALLGFGEHVGMRQVLGEDPDQIAGHFANFVEAQYDLTFEQVAKSYLFFLPLKALAAQERFKSYVTESMFGDLTSTLLGFDGSPVFGNLVDQLKTVTASCGYWIPSSSPAATPWFIVNPPPRNRTTDDSYILEGGHLNPEVDEKGRIEVPAWKPAVGTLGHWLTNTAEGIYSFDSPFIWRVNADGESSKLQYFKGVFASYAQDLRRDPKLLRAFGLEGLASINRQARIQGAPAYPDLDLPHHPYYGSMASTSPDFYMWNIYEDGDAHASATLEAMYEAMNSIVDNCYLSMKHLEQGETYEADKDEFVLEPGLSDKIVLRQQYQAEGTDGGGQNDRGPTAYPYAPHPDSSDSITSFFGKMHDEADKAEDEANSSIATEVAQAAVGPAGAAVDEIAEAVTPGPTLTHAQVDELGNTQILDFRMSLTENYNGVGGGVQYPRRMPTEKYDELATTASSVKQMFGSRAGYTELQDFPDDLLEATTGSVIERDVDPSHRFNVASIKQLAKASARDITSQKRTMRRAYPTFKLFFVEEDEFESRLLNFDDFFSYNGVTSFNVVQSRKSPADHAVITLLNVGGSLDGTKRDAVVDLDYYSAEFAKTKIPGEESKTGGDTTTQGTVLDQPFGAVVLRPGLNVQLRVGYSNDPDELQVLINGRIADIQWNASGDRAEIMVQSFGTELMQAIKGASHTEDAPTYPTTHHLLGAMMLEPELMHFGRWEFGQLYQLGEGSDARLDFNDYSRDAFLGRFKVANASLKWMLDHPVITAAVIIAGGAVISRAPGAGKLFRSLGNTLGRAKWADDVLAALGLTGSGIGQGAWLRQLVRTAERRAPGVVFNAGEGVIATGDISAVMAKNAGQRNVIYKFLQRLGAKKQVGDLYVHQARAIYATAARSAKGKAPGKAAEIMAKADTEVLNLGFKGMWMTNPSATVGLTTDFVMGIGMQPVKNVFRGFITTVPIGIAGVSGAALGVDLFIAFTEPWIQPKIDRVKAYFRSKEVSLFLSPQDDNLYPPHPKDYMETFDNGFKEQLKQLGLWTVRTGVSAFTYSDEMGYSAARWAGGYDALDKRVDPNLCEFAVTGQTIWDIFHEMSLRHPGWIYGTRPYGNKFRYTMFFGVPSQRYWARPADNTFISRANDLHRLLSSDGDDPDITIDEFRMLYGDEYGGGYTVEEINDSLILSARNAAVEEGYRVSSENGADFFIREVAAGQGTVLTSDNVADSTGGYQSGALLGADPVVLASDVPVEDSRFYKAAVNTLLSTHAILEYMSALNLRFEPFRRYHSLSSDHDLVWNGLISSENAVYNAVDVTYFGDDYADGPAGSELFKAHAFIPDHKLRVLPLEPSYNVRGYGMAMRYGVGALLHTMRDMYRGELISLGNARIRPWDICILSDSYNDMVGPVEVEQVVHSFSHETGFITEIKPGAVVLANEISSWPVLEAMKMMSLATKDVEDSYQGLRLSEAGSIAHAVDWLLGKGAGGSTEYAEHLQERVDAISPFDAFALEDGTSDAADIDALGGEVKKALGLRGKFNDASRWLVAGASLAAAGVAFKAAPFVLKAVPQLGAEVSAFTRVAGASATGLAVFGSGAALMGMAGTATPSLQWLLGGPVLFLSCLRGDSIMMIPLMKNGHPIVSGLNLSDPSMIWNNFKGDLGRWADDHISGTRDLTDIWRLYGTHSWRRLNAGGLDPRGNFADESKIAYAQLTGEEG